MKTCSISDCHVALYARDYCRKHYMRLWRHGVAEYCAIIPPLWAGMRSIPNLNGYAAHRDGSIWSCRKFGERCGYGSAWLKLPEWADKDGYLWVRIYKDGKANGRKVAHLILETFVGLRPPRLHSLHYPDRDVKNNKVENLRWGTAQENSDDKLKMETQARGTSNGMVKLTEENVCAIRASEGKTCLELAKEYGVGPTAISAIRTRKTWKQIKPSAKR